MPKPSLSSQLDAAVETMLSRQRHGAGVTEESAEVARFYGTSTSKEPATADGSRRQDLPEKVAQLVPVAEALCLLPREPFRENLRLALERRALMGTTARQAAERSKVRPVPQGYHTVTPYLAVKRAAEAIDFYKRAFGASEVSRLRMPDGKIGHAEIQIGDSRIMLSDEFPEYGARSPESIGATPVSIHLYVEDVDSLVAQAAAAGATITSPAKDYEYGERQANLKDPFGHSWTLATFKEQVSAEEYQRREALKTQSGAGSQQETPKPAAKSGQHVRPGFAAAVPYLTVSDGYKAIEFYRRAFGAKEIESMRFGDPGGRLAHGEVTVGDSGLMLSGESEEYGKRGPQSLGGTPVKIHLFVEDVDALAARAIAAGAKVVRPVQDQFYGDRSGQNEDPFGHVWIISSHIEDVSPQEIERRTTALMAGQTNEATQPAAAGASSPGVREGASATQSHARLPLPRNTACASPYSTSRFRTVVIEAIGSL